MEDLFYNVMTRRKALSNFSDEYARILDVLNRYAVHNIGIAITCKKHGQAAADAATTSTATRLDTVRAIFGVAVAREVRALAAAACRLARAAADPPLFLDFPPGWGGLGVCARTHEAAAAGAHQHPTAVQRARPRVQRQLQREEVHVPALH